MENWFPQEMKDVRMTLTEHMNKFCMYRYLEFTSTFNRNSEDMNSFYLEMSTVQEISHVTVK